MIKLWSPNRRCLGGICLGDPQESVLASGEFFEDPGPDPDEHYLVRFDPDMRLTLNDGFVVSIAAHDECVLDDVNLIGLPLEAAAWRLDGIAEQTDRGAIDMFVTESGVELWVRDGVICQVHISDWALIPE